MPARNQKHPATSGLRRDQGVPPEAALGVMRDQPHPTSEGSVALPATECVSGGSEAGSSDWTDLSCQSIKLVGKRHLGAALHHELTFSNHVHQFNAGQDALR